MYSKKVIRRVLSMKNGLQVSKGHLAVVTDSNQISVIEIGDTSFHGDGGLYKGTFPKKPTTDVGTRDIPVIILSPEAGQKPKPQNNKVEIIDPKADHRAIEELNICLKNVLSILKEFKEQYQREIAISAPENRIPSQDEKLLQNLRGYIEDNMEDPSLGVTSLMDKVHISRTQLHRKLKKMTGLSATEFIRSIRLKKAAQLLKQNADYVTQIGYQIGFSDHSYFAKCFKEHYGLSPSAYAKS